MRLQLVPVGELDPEGFDSVLSSHAAEVLHQAERLARKELAGRRIWNVNSTSRGGGVAEMLVTVLAYARGAGVDARWAVICADAEFFAITKRIHNRLHGIPGDGGPLGDAERGHYEASLAPNGGDFLTLLAPGDIVILHDPQTAGLIPLVRAAGHPVVWRCHVGLDVANDLARSTWSFLSPYVTQADAYVFSREAFVWDELDPARRFIIAPSIDVFAPKNAELEPSVADAILTASGVRAGHDGAARFRRMDGSDGQVLARAQMSEDRPLTAADRYVLQVSRWDSLKDPLGVVEGFARHVVGHSDAHLVCAGPDVTAVADDPEGAAARDRVRERFLGTHSLIDYLALLERLL